MTGYTFNPASSILTVSNANITGVNFAATAVTQNANIEGFWQVTVPGGTVYISLVQSGYSVSGSFICDSPLP